MSGIAIGHVKQVDLIKEKEVHVSFDINSRHKHLVRKDTKARLQQRGFVGDWEIVLTGGTLDFAVIEEHDTLRSDKIVLIEEVIEMAVGIVDTILVPLMEDIAGIIKGIEAGDGTVGQIFKNDTLFKHINKISANTVGITANTVGITSNVRKLTAEASGTVRNVDSLLTTFNVLGKDVVTILDTLTPLIGTVNKTIEDVGEILKDVKTLSGEAPEMLDRLQHDLGEVEMMLRTLQEGWLFKSIGGNAPKNPHLADTP
jgi:ABC-type transporter Mla subunit MlaD